MPQSLARIPIHLIFSTKNRQPSLTDTIRDPLHGYMAVVLNNFGCHTILINSVADHVHVLFDLGRIRSVSEAVDEIKTTSSKWLKSNGPHSSFAWQLGYGAFAVSASNVPKVHNYIANQQVHHRTRSFQEEFREFLSRHGMPLDERYVWD